MDDRPLDVQVISAFGATAWHHMRTWPRDAVLRALGEAYLSWDARQRLRIIESLTVTQQIDTGTRETRPDPSAKPSTISTAPYDAEMRRLRDLDVPHGGSYQLEYRAYLAELQSEREAIENDRRLAEQQAMTKGAGHAGRDGGTEAAGSAEDASQRPEQQPAS